MVNEPLKPTSPFSLRLTCEEPAQLERDMGGMFLGAHVRSRIFDETLPIFVSSPPRFFDHHRESKLVALLG